MELFLRLHPDGLTFWNEILSTYSSTQSVASAVLAAGLKLRPQRLVRSECSFHELLFVTSLARQGRDYIRSLLGTFGAYTGQLCVNRHDLDSHLPERALEIQALTDVPKFVERTNQKEWALWLASMLKQLKPNKSGQTAAQHEQALSVNFTELKFLTYNVWGLPRLFGFGARDFWRYEKIAQVLSAGSCHIVGLQEVWNGAARSLVEKSAFPYVGGGDRAGKFLRSSGLVTLSRSPIIYEESIAFGERSGDMKEFGRGCMNV